MKAKSRPPAYFEKLYAKAADPWNFETSAYEQEKYQSTITALGGRHFTNAFEAGCSIGVLTKQLAAHCDRLLAADFAQTALAAAAQRCHGLHHVAFRNLRIPAQWPQGETFDLILISEVLYFLSPADIAATARRARQSLATKGLLVLVNYTVTIDEPCSGDEAARHFMAACGLQLLETVTHEKYRIDILSNDP